MRKFMCRSFAASCLSFGLGMAVISGAAVQGKAPEPRLRLVPTAVRDPMINNVPAGTILVPEGWTINGTIDWNWDPWTRVSLHADIRGPQGVPGVSFYPLGAYCEPTAVIPEGQKYLGKLALRRLGPVEFLNQVGFPWLAQRRKEFAGARFVSSAGAPAFAQFIFDEWSQAAPEFAKALVDQYGLDNVVQAAKVRVEYSLNGKAIEEDFFCCVSTAPIPGSGGVWAWTTNVRSFRAEKGQLDQSMGLLLAIQSSYRPDLKWGLAVQQLNAQLIQNYKQESDAWLRTAMHNAMNQVQITDGIRQRYETRQAAIDRSMHGFSQAIRGVATYQTSSGTRVELPNGYDHYMTNSAGEVLLTKGVPNNSLPPGWVEMQAKRW